MKKSRFISKKLLMVSVILLVTLLCCAFATTVSAQDTAAEWTYSQASISDPIYVKDYFDALPRAYEAEVNFPEGTYSNASPIISNYRNNDVKDCFGFEIHASGKPAMYFYQNGYSPSNNKVIKTKTYIKFDDYNVIGKGWVRIAVANEIDKATEKSVYKLYVNGELVQTVDTYTVSVYEGDTLKTEYTSYIHDIDPIYSQSTNRELSIGNDGKNYFKGSLRSVAVYENALTATEAANTAKANMEGGSTNLMAYYDATMNGNSDGFYKDQTGKGHDASKAFFERKEAVEDYAYSFAFVGDTQFLMYRDASQNTTVYTKPIYDWIVQNKDEKKIKYVLGMGDITDRNKDIEWEQAVKYHNQLSDAGIPYAVVPGNHDDYTKYTLYNQYFGALPAFTDNIDGYYEDGRVENYYMNFEVGSTKYMIMALQYGAPDEVLAWANSVVSMHPNRQVIVITHSLLGYEGQWTEADTVEQTTTSIKTLNNGIDMWNEFISLHENIIITACGHIDPTDIKHRTDVGKNGNTVHSFLIDPQGLDKASDFKTGMVAMFYFSEDGSKVQVEYISATKTLAAQAADKNADDILYNEKNQFSFEVDIPENVDPVPDYSNVENVQCYVYAMKDGDEYYTSLGSSTTFRKALGKARDALHDVNNGAYKGGTAWIYLNKDLTAIGDSGNYNFGDMFNGTLIIDLGGHSLTITDKNYLLGFYTTNANASSFTTNVKIVNGTILTRGAAGNNRSVIRFHGEAAKYSGTRNVNIEFDNVKFEADVANTTPPIILATDAGSYYTSSQQVKANVLFNNCKFNFPTSTSFNVVKDIVPNDASGNDNVDIDVTIQGASVITAPKADAKMFIDTVGNKETVTVASNTTVILPYTENAPTVTYNTTAGIKGLASKSQKVTLTNVEYVLSGNYVNGYGYLPDSELLRTFAVFSYNGYHIASYDNYYDSMHRVVVLTKDASGGIFTGKKLTIFMNKDYKHTDSNYNNFAQINGTVAIDLNGKTLTVEKNYLFDAWAKGMTNSAGSFFLPDTKVEIKNGTIISKSPIARISGTGTGNFLFEGTKNYSFDFTNVKFEREFGDVDNKTIIFVNSFDNNDNKKFVQCNVAFNGCTFSTSGATLLDFDLSDNVLSEVVMNGCTVKADAFNGSTLLSASEGKAQTLILDKNTVLELPVTAASPSYDNVFFTDAKSEVEYVFVKSSVEAGTVTYVIKEKALATFVPKTSITLSNALIYNVYIPTSTALKSFTLDGTSYTDLAAIEDIITIGGNNYYHIAIELPSAYAARDISLNAVITVGSTDYIGTWTVSIPKYTARVLASESATDVEKTLAKDVLAYIKAAYNYFDTHNDAEEIARVNTLIESIIGGYTAAPVSAGTTVNAAGVTDVTLNLDAKPTIRFYVTDMSLEFYVGEKKLNTVKNETEGYIELDVYAYALCETITYGEGGSYHISSFVNGALGTEYESLVKAFVKYVESAAAYRNSIVNN